MVFNKIQFANPGISAVTQGETIEWQAKELTATVMRDDGVKHGWQKQSTPMDTEADAEAAIKKALNITNPNPTLGTLTVSSAAGSETGETEITVAPPITYGNHYVYQVNTDVTLPAEYGEDVSSWTPWNGMSAIQATTGQEIGVVEADAANKAVKAGKATVTASVAAEKTGVVGEGEIGEAQVGVDG